MALPFFKVNYYILVISEQVLQNTFNINAFINKILKQIDTEKIKDTALVFTFKGKPIGRIKKALACACEKAAIKDFRFHDLRHTYVTNMRKAGVNQTVIMKVTGHKTFSMFAHYDTVDISDAQDAVRKLDKFLENMDGTASNMPQQ